MKSYWSQNTIHSTKFIGLGVSKTLFHDTTSIPIGDFGLGSYSKNFSIHTKSLQLVEFYQFVDFQITKWFLIGRSEADTPLLKHSLHHKKGFRLAAVFRFILKRLNFQLTCIRMLSKPRLQSVYVLVLWSLGENARRRRY